MNLNMFHWKEKLGKEEDVYYLNQEEEEVTLLLIGRRYKLTTFNKLFLHCQLNQFEVVAFNTTTG